MLYARTNAEAHLYMDLTPCACGDAAFERASSVVDEGGVLCSRYRGPCRTCKTERVFTFELPEKIRPPVRGTIEYGGSDASRIIDPGQWMAVADHRAKLNPGTVEDLQVAAAALDEILKFIPAGGERVPDHAFTSARGRAVRDTEPGRFRRIRLEAVRDTYRRILEERR
jgi:hypothetical protein